MIIDALGRVTTESFYESGESTAFNSIVYSYNGNSRQLASRDSADYSYDGLNKLTAEDATLYASDILGNPTNAADDGLAYLLDDERRVVEVKDGMNTVAAYDYDRFGRRV